MATGTIEGKEIIKAVSAGMVQALEGVGITEKKLADMLKEELGATGEQAYYDPSEERGDRWQYSKPTPAWAIRQKARQDAHRLRGDYGIEDVGAARPVQLNLILGNLEDKPVNGGARFDRAQTRARVFDPEQLEQGEEK